MVSLGPHSPGLLYTEKLVSAERDCRDAGSEPVSWLPARLRYVNADRLPSVEGTEPSKRLFSRPKETIDVSRPSVVGSGPPRWVLLRHRPLRKLVSAPTSEGKVPLIEL